VPTNKSHITRPESRVNQVDSSQSVAVSPSQFSGAIGFITSHFKSTSEVNLTSNLALSSSLKCGYRWVLANKTTCNIFHWPYTK